MRLEFAWKQFCEVAGMGVGLRFWIGQHLFWPLRDTHRDVICNPRLTLIQKVQATALSCLLILLRNVAWIMMRVGIRYDVRKNWG